MRRAEQGMAAATARHLSHLLIAGLLSLAAFGATAHEFNFKDMQGREQRLSSYRGKWVLVNFWATWCPPCLAEMPDLVELHNAHKDKDLVVIGIALDSTLSAVSESVAKLNVTYPVVLGNYKLAGQLGKIEALPTSYLFDPTGKPVGRQEGGLTRNSVEQFMLAKSKQKSNAAAKAAQPAAPN